MGEKIQGRIHSPNKKVMQAGSPTGSLQLDPHIPVIHVAHVLQAKSRDRLPRLSLLTAFDSSHTTCPNSKGSLPYHKTHRPGAYEQFHLVYSSVGST